MGTLKSVCSSWFALISRDKYEHTHLRVPISKVRFIYSNFDVFSVTPMQFSAIHVPRSQNEDQALFSRVFKIYSLKTYLREGTFPSLFLFDFQFRFCNDIQQQHLCPWKRCSDLIFGFLNNNSEHHLVVLISHWWILLSQPKISQ